MAKIHLLLKKEDIDQVKMNGEKVAVVFDVLLATSTIVTALNFGAKEVIPVLNEREAKEEAKDRLEGSYLLVGEYAGKTIKGFLPPNPLFLQEKVKGKTVILSTTNGTVAISRSANAKKVYIASLLNSLAIAEFLLDNHKDETIVIVCSGSSGEFNVEDFYGAGYLIAKLLGECPNNWELTDAAHTAYLFYLGTSDKAEEILSFSGVGQMLQRYGFDKEIGFVAQKGIFEIVPYLENGKSVVTGGIPPRLQDIGNGKR